MGSSPFRWLHGLAAGRSYTKAPFVPPSAWNPRRGKEHAPPGAILRPTRCQATRPVIPTAACDCTLPSRRLSLSPSDGQRVGVRGAPSSGIVRFQGVVGITPSETTHSALAPRSAIIPISSAKACPRPRSLLLNPGLVGAPGAAQSHPIPTLSERCGLPTNPCRHPATLLFRGK